MEELPIKVDLLYGLDGTEIKEIVSALRQTALTLHETGKQKCRARFMLRLADKIERLHTRRAGTLSTYLTEKYDCEKSVAAKF